uniref:Uncharacterized protein n=1 Tax=Oryza sativa subsp. japonica TaxID=39947 RepID=Q6KA30_ORYSJ|nr:hypothetical protein [Oryza sativa Japonica Group]
MALAEGAKAAAVVPTRRRSGAQRRRRRSPSDLRLLAGFGGWPAVLAATVSANDADGGLGGDVADGDSEAAAGSGGCSRRRWLALVAAATAADLRRL